MTDVQERRSPGTNRVSLETLVEICGNDMGTPAFEAEALDVSARGMHLRTAYLPEDGAPLVCRFEDQGREIVVEGVVAWRKESKKGGDFGVKFTALDSRSVDSLRELVKRDIDRGDSNETARGSRVRLHIEGLGAPMKARVRTGGVQKVQVGSNLEFLKVGRKLEIEDLEAGGKREARIDGVEVVVDPQTQVPQLVVALRYEGVEDTPEPAVIDLGGEPVKPASLVLDASAVTTDARAKREPSPKDAESLSAGDAPSAEDTTPSGDVPAATDDDLDDAIPAATRAARRLGTAAENAGVKARDASIAAAKLGSNALSGMTKLFGGAAAKLAALRAGTRETTKRRTSPPPEGPMSLDGKRLRPQASKRDDKGEAPESAPAVRRLTKKTALAGAVGIAVLGTTLAFAMRSEKPAGEKQAAAEPAAKLDTKAAAQVAPESVAASLTSPPGAPVTANVPLFGPTPMATAEPAPLGPPPTAEGKAVEAAELAAARAAEPEAAEDEEFVDEPAGKSAKKASASKSGKDMNPEDVPAFGRGKLHLPTIHRLRLDGPGAAIHGAVDPMGFTVLIPNRKLMEQGAGMAKRDARFARVRTTNTPGGAQVRIAFNGNVPAYRVRLRRDYVELLVSAAEEPKDKKAPAKDAAKSTAKPAAAKAKPAGKIPAR
ncbi:MAG TPA: PilZ domain-containing protein [Polyangiaceae bacterium]